MELSDDQIMSRVAEDATLLPYHANRPGRPNKGKSRAIVAEKHSKKNCVICTLPRSIRLRVEEDFVNFVSVREMADDLIARGYKLKSAQVIYRHCVAFGFDLKRGDKIERGVARVVSKAMDLLDSGQIQLKGADLMGALNLWARLKGMLNDGQAINNILIRNNVPSLEEISRAKSSEELDDRAAKIIRELQDAGAFPGVTQTQAHYNRVKEIVQDKIGGRDAGSI